MTILLAKSIEQGGTTLAEHTAHVVFAMRTLAKALMPELTQEQYALAIRGAVLHDLGKGHPYFQASLQPGFERNNTDTPHRHELSSLLFLPLFPEEEWEILVDMVVAHHKSLRQEDANSTRIGRGLLDLVDRCGEDIVFERHASDWEQWAPLVYPLLIPYDIVTRPLERDEIRRAFTFALEHCERLRRGRSRWRGLLMSADHFASAMQDETYLRSARLFVVPDLFVFHMRAEAASEDLYPLAKVASDDPRPHTLVIAPTGAGKTDLLMRRCRDRRVFYLLPFQASINAMFLRLDAALNGVGEGRKPLEMRTDIRRVHAASRIEIDADLEEEEILQRHPGAAIKVMTPHQVASILLGTSGHEAVALDITGQDVILDEIHVYSEQTQAMTLELVRALVGLGACVHIGSATVSTELARLLRERLGGEKLVYEVRLDAATLRTYDRHIVHRLDNEAEARETVRAALQRGERVLFISNRVDRAQERFRWAKENLRDVPLLLIHSRFRRGDRAELEGKIEAFDKLAGPCLVCATQVIEVSLDISFDTLVTDAAPIDSLVQRFGRVNRRREHMRGVRPVYVIAPPTDPKEARPYDADVLLRSWNALPDSTLLDEVGLQARIDAVYPTVNVPAIDVHLADTPDGFRLRELCHRSRSLLLDVLEIESACCIRESDCDAYKKGRGDVRLRLEIPVPWKTARYQLRERPQLEKVGNSPFVVPGGWYDPELGLTPQSGEERTSICTQFL